jgi:hypothetical protein
MAFIVQKIAILLIALSLVLGCVMGFSNSAEAQPLCRNMAEHQVCVESIKRSAKYYWEYRVVVSVDGETRSAKRYDCRQLRSGVKETQSQIIANERSIQEFVCGLVER